MKIFSFIFLIVAFSQSQQKATLSGFVRDKTNKESLPYATVSIKDLKIGTATNIEGYFAIPYIPEGEFEVSVSLLGYQATTFVISTVDHPGIVHDVYLTDKAVQVSEVLIDAQKDEEKRSTQTGRIRMQAKDIAQMPTIGEADVFRALQMMPGVKCDCRPDAASAGIRLALHCGRGIPGDGESAGRGVRPTDRPAEKHEHRLCGPDGLGLVSWQHCAQHCWRTLPVFGSQRLKDFGAARSGECLDGDDRFPAAQSHRQCRLTASPVFP